MLGGSINLAIDCAAACLKIGEPNRRLKAAASGFKRSSCRYRRPQSLDMRWGCGHGTKGVMSEIEHAKVLEATDTFRYLGQIIVGQYECLEIQLFPHKFWHAAKTMLP